MATGMRHGLRFGCWNILGMQCGIALQLVIVGAGLGAPLGVDGDAALPSLAAYDAAETSSACAASDDPALRRQLFWQGFLVNGTNPKATIFLLAVLPQFIDPAKPLLLQYLVCAVTLTLIDLPVMGAYTYFAATVLKQMREPRQIKWMNRLFGRLFMAAGGFLATFKRAA